MKKSLKISEDLHYRIKVYCVAKKLKMNEYSEEILLREIIKLENVNNK